MSVIGSGVIGSILKGVWGGLQFWMDTRRQQAEFKFKQDLAFHKARREAYVLQIETGGDHVKTTRRILALSVCWTWCAIALYCTVFPDIPLLTLQGASADVTTHRILFGLYSREIQGPVAPITLTTGAMAYASVHLAALCLGFYFTPIGSR